MAFYKQVILIFCLIVPSAPLYAAETAPASRVNVLGINLIQADTFYYASISSIELIEIKSLDSVSNPVLKFKLIEIEQSKQQLKLNKQQLLPDLTLGAFQGVNNGASPNKYWGVQAGIAIPLFYKSDKSKINASKTELLMKDNQYQDYMLQLTNKYKVLISQLKMNETEINNYKSFGEKLAEETITNANQSNKAGNIDFLHYAYLLDNAITIKTNYLKSIYLYNLTALEINYLIK